MVPTLFISRELAARIVSGAPRLLREEVAYLSSRLDLDAGGERVSYGGYARHWEWSPHKVRDYLGRQGLRIEGGGEGKGKGGR